jgi:dTDP-4-dehydrorhamnose reductase
VVASAARPDTTNTPSPLQVWAGVECSRVRVGRHIVDQLSLTEHDRRASDIELIAALGVEAVRYPVQWERVAPRGLANAEWAWPDERLTGLRALGIRPVVGLLHHGYGPPGMSLLHPGFPQAFGRYARAVARRYPWLDAYVPINEPLTTARFSGLYGFWYPHQRSEPVFARLLLAQCLALRAASRAIREVNARAQIIVNEDVGRTFSTPELAPDAAYLNERRFLAWDVLFGRVTKEHPMYELLASTSENARVLADLNADPEPPDVVGVDHYVTSDRFLDHRVALYAPSQRDPMVPAFVDVEACRVRGIPPGSIARAIDDTWMRYRTPLMLSEIALAGEPEDQVVWWREAWSAAEQARARQIDIRAVTAWSVFGSVDWHVLMRRRDDLYAPGAFDVTYAPPLPRPLASAIARTRAQKRKAAGTDVRSRSGVATQRRGWWQRSDRFTLTV